MEIERRPSPSVLGVSEPYEHLDRHGKDYPDYSEDAMACLHFLFNVVEKEFTKATPGWFSGKTGYRLPHAEDLFRALNSYELSASYLYQLEYAIFDSPIFDSWREDIECQPRNITANSDLEGLLKKSKKLSTKSSIHNDLQRLDLYIAFKRKFNLNLDRSEVLEQAEDPSYLHQQTLCGILETDLKGLKNWGSWCTRTFSRGDRPRRAYKEPHNTPDERQYNPRTGWMPIDSHLPKRSIQPVDFLPTPILIARQWIYEHYLELITPDQSTESQEVLLDNCHAKLPSLIEQARNALSRTKQNLPLEDFNPGSYGYGLDKTKRLMTELKIENIEEVYRRLDPFESAFED